MVARVKRASAKAGGGSKVAPSSELSFVGSGSTLLDEVISGGWPLGRIVNIVGDKSTGKTLLAIEAAANFAKTYKKGKIWYREVEAAFDKSYAASLGMPLAHVDFGKKKFDTVEDIFEDMEKALVWAAANDLPGVYIIDSLDALSSRDELKRKIDDPTYGGEKAKLMGQLFRRLVRKLEASQVCVIIISQIRDNIGVKFGKKTKRTGGRALDFYASIVIYLAHIATLVRTISKQKRATGVRIRCKCEKNKIGLPFRECGFVIKFNYGIDDLQSNLEWLIELEKTAVIGLSKDKAKDLIADIVDMGSDEYEQHAAQARAATIKLWREIETSFLPIRKKYA